MFLKCSYASSIFKFTGGGVGACYFGKEISKFPRVTGFYFLHLLNF